MAANDNDLTFMKVMFYALIVELTLVIIQFAYLVVHINFIDIEADLAFTAEYMKHAGFYIFQILGFFVFIILAFVVLKRSRIQILNKMLILFVTGGVIELLFYLLMQADYQGAFLYSILDKVVAIIFGAIIYYVVAPAKDIPKAT